MKAKDIPQDKSNLASANFKELCYAVDDDGNYVTANSSGWNPKTIALSNAMAEIEERIADAKYRVLNEKSSPIEYSMELQKMDINILSSYVGIWTWRVKRHFKPSVFRRLSTKTLNKYTKVFEISIEKLKNIEYEN